MFLQNASVMEKNAEPLTFEIENGKVKSVLNSESCENTRQHFVGGVVDLKNKILLPGFIDVHVHLREPGFFYKESIASGTAAAAAGGYAAVCSMPNVNPCPDCLEHLERQTDIIKRDANVAVYPYACITEGQKGEKLVDFEALAPYVVAFSDDGKGVQSETLMAEAMRRAKATGKVLAAHSEDETLLYGGYIHAGAYAKAHGHRGISSASEYKQIERDLALAEKIGHKHHVCHVSAKESVAAIRRAKQNGVNVTCETAPHYLLLTDEDLKEDGRFKMNPPLRGGADRDALVEGILDGTIDMIATDHAPHSAEEKGRGLEKSLFGISGIETAFPLLYTHFVKTGVFGMKKLLDLMCYNPAARFGIPCGSFEKGGAANFTAFDLEKSYLLDSAKFISKGKSTPFDGCEVYGECAMTIYNGRIVWQRNSTKN